MFWHKRYVFGPQFRLFPKLNSIYFTRFIATCLVVPKGCDCGLCLNGNFTINRPFLGQTKDVLTGSSHWMLSDELGLLGFLSNFSMSHNCCKLFSRDVPIWEKLQTDVKVKLSPPDCLLLSPKIQPNFVV